MTYTPIKGDDFARVMLTPIPPSELFAMLATGARELRPYQSFVAVEYRGTWYWIYDRDYGSTRVFSTLMLLLNLVDKAGEAQLPVITIPTG